MNKELFLNKFSEDEKPLIKKYLSLRETKTENKITIFEPLIKDILEVGNGSIDERTFLNRNIDIPENEIEYLPIRTYKKLVNNVLKFADDEEQEQEQNEDIKKN